MRVTSQELFTSEQLQRINDAVRRAESSTSGEIVPVLATSAGTYDRGLFFAGISAVLAATLLLVAVFFLPFDFLQYDPWEIPLYVLLPCQLVSLLAGYHVARRFPALHRAFVSRAEMQRNVDRAAQQAFTTFHLTHTRDATGIMIFASLFERMVVVLADKAINEKHEPATWDDVRDRFIQGFTASDPTSGFEQAIEACGRLLASDFPKQEDDQDELPNHLRLL